MKKLFFVVAALFMLAVFLVIREGTGLYDLAYDGKTGTMVSLKSSGMGWIPGEIVPPIVKVEGVRLSKAMVQSAAKELPAWRVDNIDNPKMLVHR